MILQLARFWGVERMCEPGVEVFTKRELVTRMSETHARQHEA